MSENPKAGKNVGGRDNDRWREKSRKFNLAGERDESFYPRDNRDFCLSIRIR